MDCPSAEKCNRLENERLLVVAATEGDLDSIINLIKADVSVDADNYNRSLFYASKNYMTPLQIACQKGHTECAEYLIANGADVDAKDRFDVTAMHLAAEKGNISCLRALLNANAECSLPTKSSKKGYYTAVPYLGGTTPLHLAAAKNHIECIQELIEYGADYNAVDEQGKTSLYVAAESRYEQAIVAHLKHAIGRDILSLPSYTSRDTPLHFAVKGTMVNGVQALLAAGSDVDHKNMSGHSPLTLAIKAVSELETESLEILRMVVVDGYNLKINSYDGAKNTPLYYVVFRDYPRKNEMAKLLISYGADVNIKNKLNGLSLLEQELSTTSEITDLLQYILRSMLHLPRWKSLKITKNIRRHRRMPSMEYEDPPFRNIPITQTTDSRKEWYEKIATNPRTLQHYCRYQIRKSLGPYIKNVSKLPIPKAMESYLLLERGD